MKFIKKILCILTICTVLTPYTAFADNNAEYQIETLPALPLFSYEQPLNARADIFPPTDEEKELIQYIIDGFAKRAEKIEISDKYTITYERFNVLYLNYISKLLQLEHPEIFYLNNISCSVTKNTSQVTSITPHYMNDEEIDSAMTAIDEETEKIENLITEDMTDVQKILVVHDYIVSNYEYDESTYEDPNNASRTLDSMVMQKKGVCQGYTYLFQYVTRNLGFECVSVPSNVHGHIWNKIKLKDKWYNIDLTYDDPLPDSSSYIRHDFFLLNDSEISADKDHSEWNEYKWDGTTPAEVSDSTDFSNSILHSIGKATVYKNDVFYCFNNKNNISTIDFENNELKPLYSNSAKFEWYFDDTNIYSKYFSTMVLYKDDIYFNSPDKIYKYNTKTNKIKEVYDFEKANPDKTNKLKTYIYGLKIKDDDLYAEYMLNNVKSLIPVTIKDDDNEYETTCSSKIEAGADGDVTVTLSIPEEEKNEAMVYIAEYDDKNLFLGFKEREENENSITFTPDANCQTIKVFIWNNKNIPLSNVQSLTVVGSEL